MINFFDLLIKLDIKEKQRQLKLEDNPKGFHLDDGTYTCCVCGDQISGDKTWYDKNGIKCLFCQKALDKKLIPAKVCKDKDNWYSVWELDYYFKIKSARVRKLIRQEKLKARIVTGEAGSAHFCLLLIKDNKGVLPEKPKSKIVTTEDGYSHVEYEKVILPEILASG